MTHITTDTTQNSTNHLPGWCLRFDNRAKTPVSQHIGFVDLAAPNVQAAPNVPAYVAQAAEKIENGANPQETMSAVINEFVLNMARRDLGDEFETARFMGAALESFTVDAKAGRFHKLIENDGTFDDLLSLYENTEHTIGTLYMSVLAPNALSYNDFVHECSKATVKATISPACPACGSQLEFATDFVISELLPTSLEVVCECSHCGLSPTLDIEIVKPQSEDERMVRSYIRSLLVFEQYDKAHELGPIHERRVLENVATQAAKTFAHIPNGFSIDYQALVKEEISR